MKARLNYFERALLNNPGDFLLSHTVTRAVPSAPAGLTSVFGMGTGVTLPTESPENFLRSQIFNLRSQKILENRIVMFAFFSLGKFAQARICCLSKFYGQAKGLISSGQLSTLLHLHIHPINVVVYHESHWQN